MGAGTQRALEAVNGAALVVDGEGRVLGATEGCAVVFRTDPATIEGATLADLVDDGYLRERGRERFRHALAALADGDDGTRFQVVIRPAEGDDAYGYAVHATARRDGDGLTGAVCRLEDLGTTGRGADTVEALHAATRDLMAAGSRERVYDVAGTAANEVLGFPGTGVRTHDPDAGVLRHVTFGGKVADIDERPPFDVDDSPHGRAFHAGETVVDDIGDGDDPFDRDVFSQTMYVPVGDHGVLSVGKVSGEFDDTDVRLAEILAENTAAALTQVIQNERLRARREELQRQNERLDRFASVLSHDLRNPLNVAQAAFAQYREESDPDRAADVEFAHDRIETIVEDVLALARTGRAVEEPEPCSVAALADRAWAAVDTDGATLAVETDRTVAADPDRLVRALENCFRNAVEHGSTSPDSQARRDAVEHGPTSPRSDGREDTAGASSGEPSVADAPEDAVDHGGTDVTVTVGDAPDGFYVADDGPGIPPDERDRVFDHGFTTEDGGTGLGLAIVSAVVEAHGWDVAVGESERGGARFDVTVE